MTSSTTDRTSISTNTITDEAAGKELSLIIRPGGGRGHFDHGWLDTFHSFSFGDYYDARHMGFRALRVINEDRVQPGGGFGMHGHRDMEIITLVLSGSLEHRDSMGNGSVLRAGDLQHMSAGTGVRHSEFNPSATEPVHLYQIWLMPNRSGLQPAYSELREQDQPQLEGLRLVGSAERRANALQINQDVEIFLASLRPGQSVVHRLAQGRHAWIQVLRGQLELNGQIMSAGDGAAASGSGPLSMVGSSEVELMLFDLA